MYKRTRKLRFDALEDRRLMDAIPVGQELQLHSLPGAPATLFLDFNGHFQSQEIGGFDHIKTPAWDRDGIPLMFSDIEQDNIKLIWGSVAEAYAPFNIDVTTVDPDPGLLHLEDPYLRVVMSGDGDFSCNGFGGLTDQDFDGTFNAYADDDDPNVSYVFNKREDGTLLDIEFLALAAAHEAGHSFGNDHNVFGVINSGRAPIMLHVPLNATRHTWSDKGSIAVDASNRPYGYRDEMAVIASADNGFGYRPDDHGNFFSNATLLLPRSDGNLGMKGNGIIESTGDKDYFKFTTGGGSAVSVLVTRPAFGNLDATLRLFNAAGTLIAESNDPNKLSAEVLAPLVAGTYFVQVGSFGAYGDVGQYSVSVAELQGPQIVKAEIQSVLSTSSLIRVTFDEPIDPSSFTKEDVRISYTPLGMGVRQIIAATNGAFRVWDILVDKPITPTAQWGVSIGPSIKDWFGNAMDQNRNGIKNEADDALRLMFIGDGFGTADLGSSSPQPTKFIRLTPRLTDAVFQQVK